MKQNLLKTCLVMLLAVFGWGNAWADTFTSKDALSALWTCSTTIGSYSGGATGYDGVQFGSSKSAAGTFTLTSKSTFSKVESVTIKASTGEEATITSVKVGSSELTAPENTTIASGTANKNQSFTFIGDGTASGNIVITFNATKKAMYVGAIDIVGAGSSTPEPTTYTVTVANNIANGTVTATPATAAEGATVKLTATPDEGYVFGAWDVKGVDNTTVSVTNNQFTMPAQNVTVSATFNEKPATTIYASLAELVAAGAPTKDGREVTVTLTNEEILRIALSGNYRNGIFVKVGEKEIELYSRDVPEAWVAGGKVSGTITCPWKLYNTTWELCPTTWNDLTYTAPEVSPEPEPEGPNVTFDLTKAETVAATTELLAWTSSYASMYAEKASSQTNTNNYYPGTPNQNYKNTRFYKNSTLTFNPAPGVTVSTIVYEATTTGYATALSTSTWTNATASVSGTTVTITPTDGTKPVVAEIGGTTGATSVKVFYTGTPTAAPYVPSTTEPEPEPTVYTITVNEYIQNGSVSVSAASAEEGTVITLTATPAEGYELEEYVVTRTDNNTELTVANNKFTMPAANVSVTATFKSVAGGEPEPEPNVGGSETYTFGSFTSANDVNIPAGDFTITLHKNTGSTTPQWNANSSEARVYAKGSVDIASDLNIVKIVYEYVENAGGKNNVKPTIDAVVGATNAGKWNAETKTWTGCDKTVTLTTSGTAGNLGFKSITVYFEEGALPVNGTINFVAENEEGYWATFSSDRDVIFSDADVVVYTVSYDGETLHIYDTCNTSLSAITDKTADAGLGEGWAYGYYVQANTGVLVYCLAPSAKYYYTENNEENILYPINNDPENNMLRPASAAMTGDYNFYKLAYNDYEAKTGLGFYWGAADGAAFTCKPGTAYLAVPKEAASNLRGFSLTGEGSTTGIESIVAGKADAAIYNLQGQRVSRLQQGVNIVNGKKVIR